MQIVGMIIGIAVAKYVLHLDSLPAIFAVAMVGWFIGNAIGGAGGSGVGSDRDK